MNLEIESCESFVSYSKNKISHSFSFVHSKRFLKSERRYEGRFPRERYPKFLLTLRA
ncbi:hypothetical protein LEP1GSC193_0558 [Leptospira alstonii serovar Pingchang str. 80-412]|uniref:Uncharacterized protein n=2 Tax=Leptospira alstonii TaxID=28452 RepID=M6CVR3_9LEPT|nr:hypothetical protein LEP1GSC194_3342 [Leptospira alstonii serovar Sichuan str. 79601]EQA79598.1 hypothetical protein LEP1GSC193_0558 [Leptospira alstonii serovar Pingchang str. 80-412]